MVYEFWGLLKPVSRILFIFSQKLEDNRSRKVSRILHSFPYFHDPSPSKFNKKPGFLVWGTKFLKGTTVQLQFRFACG